MLKLHRIFAPLEGSIKIYYCYENLLTNRFYVQLSHIVRLPLEEGGYIQAEREHHESLDVLTEYQSFEWQDSIAEAIRHHDEEFGEMIADIKSGKFDTSH
ncbi:hypothetical protein [Asticcacaulis excentricus]|uniref:hypothetical protein n=1 Tax=Asticcacaulis excentricus TaxID=78587 RepID=UPI000F84629D|nr:hypothetical protein [Asticcacaulis excentricus]